MAPEKDKIKEVKDLNDYEEELQSAGPKLVVADFTAKWCGPCHRMNPVLDNLSSKYPDVVFLKVDVDRCKDVQNVENVSSMPTFIFYKEKSKVDVLQGADPDELESKIKKYYEVEGAGGEPALIPGQQDLKGHLDLRECECLNADDDHGWQNMFANDESFCESDCDEQMLLNLAFASHVKLHSIAIQAPGNSGPKTVKLFANITRPLDFDSAESTVATQEIEFTSEDLEFGKPLPLKFVKFQNLDNLTIFFRDNVGGEEKTRVDRLLLLGNPLITTNMEEFKRVAGKTGEAE